MFPGMQFNRVSTAEIGCCSQWCARGILSSQSHKPVESGSSKIFWSRVRVESWL